MTLSLVLSNMSKEMTADLTVYIFLSFHLCTKLTETGLLFYSYFTYIVYITLIFGVLKMHYFHDLILYFGKIKYNFNKTIIVLEFIKILAIYLYTFGDCFSMYNR